MKDDFMSCGNEIFEELCNKTDNSEVINTGIQLS